MKIATLFAVCMVCTLCFPVTAQVPPGMPAINQVRVFDAADTALGKADSLPHYMYSKKNNETRTSRPVSRSASPQFTDNNRHWVFKFSPSMLLRGAAPVFVERKLGKSFSLEAGAGITTEDYFKEFFMQGKLLNKKDPNAEKLNGFAARLSVRYFFKHDALNGFYIAPEIAWMNYRKEVKGIYLNSNSRYTLGKLMDQQKYADFLVLLGTENANELNQEMNIDWYVGLGIRASREENVKPDERNTTAIQVSTLQHIGPLITAGLKVGLGF